MQISGFVKYNFELCRLDNINDSRKGTIVFRFGVMFQNNPCKVGQLYTLSWQTIHVKLRN